jgi:hypothetical protein
MNSRARRAASDESDFKKPVLRAVLPKEDPEGWIGRSASTRPGRLVGSTGGLPFQAVTGDGRRVRGDPRGREPGRWALRLVYNAVGLFMTAPAYPPRVPETVRESQLIRPPGPGTSPQTSPSAHRVGRLSPRVAGLRGESARALLRSPRSLTRSRDSAANKTAISSCRLASSCCLGTSGKTSPLPDRVGRPPHAVARLRGG